MSTVAGAEVGITPVAEAEIRRIDALAAAESRRIDGLLKAQETAVNAALAAAEKAVAAALAASEKAVNKAEVAQQRTNEGQNEFRAQLRDQAATLMPRTEAENTHRELRGLVEMIGRQVNDLQKVNAGTEGKGRGQVGTVAAIVGAVSFAATAIGLVIVIATSIAR